MPRYRLVFYGDLFPDVHRETCVSQLSRLFRHAPGKLERFLFEQPPATIKTVDDFETAQRFVDAFAQAGAILHIEEVDPFGWRADGQSS